jgi:ParB-like chromosome segregation protein Spo0J
MRIDTIALRRIKPNPRNARIHSGKQIALIEKSIKTVGFANPVLVDESLMLIAGHGRLTAAKNLGFREVPAIILPGLTEAKKRLLALADNKLPEHASWDRERLAVELPELADLLLAEDIEIDSRKRSRQPLDFGQAPAAMWRRAQRR